MLATLGEWAISLLLAGTCPTPTAWVETRSVLAVCGDADGVAVFDARNPWALPWDPLATRAEFDAWNESTETKPKSDRIEP